MAIRRLIALLLLALAFAAPGGSALANVCRSIQAELAAIGRSSGADRATAQRHAIEAQRIQAHIRSIGCDRSGIFAFGAPPPQECGTLRARLHQHGQASAAANGSEGRRQQLQSMLSDYNCNAQPKPTRGEPLVAGLFDDRRRPPSSLEIRPDDPIDPPPIESRIRGVGGRAVCVRTCDGYFFPVQLRTGTRQDDGDEACQALCPAAETRLYSMRSREIDDAVTPDGDAYTDLPNAFLYRKRFDPGCFCRRPGESIVPGAQVLNPENGGAAGLTPLNPDASEIEEPPLRGRAARQGDRRDAGAFGKKQPPAPPAPPHPPADTPADRLVTTEQGEVREIEGKDGTKRTVRIIAPELARGPAEAKAPSAPARAPTP